MGLHGFSLCKIKTNLIKYISWTIWSLFQGTFAGLSLSNLKLAGRSLSTAFISLLEKRFRHKSVICYKSEDKYQIGKFYNFFSLSSLVNKKLVEVVLILTWHQKHWIKKKHILQFYPL